MNKSDPFSDCRSSNRNNSESRLPTEKKHSRNVSIELSSFDWDANVVNFISNFIHPGIYRRKSYNIQPNGHLCSQTLPRKTHRRIASATITYPNFNANRTNLFPSKGHSRNISDPGKIFCFIPEVSVDIPEQNALPYSPISSVPSENIDGSMNKDNTIKEKQMTIEVIKKPVQNHYCRFGCFSIRAFPKLITSILSLMVLFQSVVVSGYMSSMFTTIERRFDLKNSQTGYIVSAYEVGAVISIILVSLFHSKKKTRPRIIAFSGILMTIGFIIFTMPHYFSGYYNPNLKNGTSSCSSLKISGIEIKTDYSISLPIFLISQFLAGLGASPIYVLAPTYLWDNLPEAKYPIYSACFYCCAAVGPALGYIFAAVFLRIYIDHPSEPTYTNNDGLTIHMVPGDDKFLGAWWIGMLINSGLIFLTTLPAFSFPTKFGNKQGEKESLNGPNRENDNEYYYDDINHDETDGDGVHIKIIDEYEKQSDVNNNDLKTSPSKQDLKHSDHYPNDERLQDNTFYHLTEPNGKTHTKSKGFYEFSGRKLKPILRKKRPPPNVDSKESKSKCKQIIDDLVTRLRDIRKICQVIFTNYIWLGVTIVNVFENSIVSAFVTYAAKYIETMFRISPHLAAITTGGVVIPSALLGVICGALMMQKFRPSVHSVLKWMHLTMMLSLGTNLGLILLGCNDNQIAGLTAKYDGRSWPYDSFPSNPFPKNLTASCNHECSNDISFEPVCWISSNQDHRMTYYSSCHAGCQQINENKYDLDKCYCLTNSSLTPESTLEPGHVKMGMCSINCPNFYPFLFLLFLHIFLTTLHQNPSNVLTLACVDSEYGSQALGLQVFFIRILAFVPAPIYFGQLIDSVCQERSIPTKTTDFSQCRNLFRWNMTNSQLEEKVETLIGPTVEGVCKAYSPLGLAFMTMGGLLLLKICSFVGLIITFQITRLKYENNPAGSLESSEVKDIKDQDDHKRKSQIY